MEKLMETSDAEESPEICRIKVSRKLKKRAPVFVANFDHSRVKVNEDNVLKFESFKSVADSEKNGLDANRTLLARSHHTEFKGSVPNDAHHFRNFIGVRDKTTGKMKLYDSVLFRMKPVVKYTEDTAKTTASWKEKSYWEGLQDLTQNFGIKSHKRAMSAHLKHANMSIDEEFNISDMSLLETPPVPRSDSQVIDYLPAINRNAEIVDNVFDINEIITPEEDSVLETRAQEVLDDPAKFSELQSRSCMYVAGRLEKYNAIEKIKYLIYFNYLVTFQRLRYSDFHKKASPVKEVPEPFRQRLLDCFTLAKRNEKTGKMTRSCSMQMKDKIVAYIIVLALYIDDFLVVTTELLADLTQIKLPKLTTISHALGCHVKSQKTGEDTIKLVELKLPLFVLMPKYAKKKSTSRA